MDGKRSLGTYAGIPFRALWVKAVTGTEHLPKEGPFILAPNHCSYIEHFLIGAVVIPLLGRPLCFLAKKEHFEGTQRWWHAAWGRYVHYIPIDRSRGAAALESAADALERGSILVIYPEGTRSPDGRLQRAKTGVARLALASRAPVIPLGIVGAHHILPKGKYIPRPGRAELHFGKPLSFGKYYNKAPTKKALRGVTTAIMEEIARLSKQRYLFD